MHAINIVLVVLTFLTACAGGESIQGAAGPPYNVTADGEQVRTPESIECIQVFCDKYPEYAFDPKYCCIGGYGKGDKE